MSTANVINSTSIMVPCMSYWQIIVTKCAFIVTILSYILFWVWILSNTGIAWIIWLCVLMAIDQIFHLHVLWMMPYMAKVNTSIIDVPSLRIAMITTKTPSEPLDPILCKTLTAMLGQVYGTLYDVWVADEKVTESATAWYIEHGVKISCRYGLPDYHQLEWPRRTRCKEGNLRYFYDLHGHEYDVVFQFDSDHAPEPDYLAEAMPIFADPNVAYIAFPSISDGGSENSWISRARMNSEAFNYGPLQASYSYMPVLPGSQCDNLMPNMTGSHYAVRVSALQKIGGGLGPELDEDLSTSMMFASHGLYGVYSLNSIAHGEGPECFEDAMKQEFQWARSATILYLRWRHIIFPTTYEQRRNTSFKIWMRLLTTAIWYITCISWFIWIIISPIMAYIFGWCANGCIISLIDIIIHILPVGIISHGTLLWCRYNGWLRPIDTPIFCPMAIMYKLIRIIWMTWGCMAGIIEILTGRISTITVTPKGNDGSRFMSPTAIMPIAIMIIIQLVAFYIPLVISQITHKPIIYVVSVFLILQSILLTISMFIIIGMHYWENHIPRKGKHYGNWPWYNTLGHVLVISPVSAGVIVTMVIEWNNINNSTLKLMIIPKFYTSFDMFMMASAYGLAFLWTGSIIITNIIKPSIHPKKNFQSPQQNDLQLQSQSYISCQSQFSSQSPDIINSISSILASPQSLQSLQCHPSDKSSFHHMSLSILSPSIPHSIPSPISSVKNINESSIISSVCCNSFTISFNDISVNNILSSDTNEGSINNSDFE